MVIHSYPRPCFQNTIWISLESFKSVLSFLFVCFCLLVPYSICLSFKQQKETRLHSKHFAQKSPQLSIQVNWSQVVVLKEQKAIQPSLCHLLTRISFPSVSNNMFFISTLDISRGMFKNRISTSDLLKAIQTVFYQVPQKLHYQIPKPLLCFQVLYQHLISCKNMY